MHMCFTEVHNLFDLYLALSRITWSQ